MNLKSFAAAVLIAIGAVGCSKDSSSPSGTMPTPLSNLTVNPTDGQGNVRLDAAITLTFVRSVDRAVVERSVHLISERMMADSLCPDSSMISHGGMGNVMIDSSTMRHMGQIHSTKGSFGWNPDTTECYFRPDSMMTLRTQYMIHIGPEMMQMMRNRMGEMVLMGGHGSGMMQDDMMLHFVTMDTTGEGGHGGHH